jgi:hypothetical protein
MIHLAKPANFLKCHKGPIREEQGRDLEQIRIVPLAQDG